MVAGRIMGCVEELKMWSEFRQGELTSPFIIWSSLGSGSLKAAPVSGRLHQNSWEDDA